VDGARETGYTEEDRGGVMSVNLVVK